jgi:TcpE family
MAEQLIVRSYRRVFEVDRRIYRVDRWVLPVPGGVPLRGVAYFVAALLAAVLAARLPVIGGLVGELAAPLRYVVMPFGVALLGTQVAPDGRVAHRFAWGWLCWRLRSRRRSSGRTVPLEAEPVAWHGVVATAWDESATALHRGRVHGPAMVTFGVPVRVVSCRRGRVVVRQLPDGEAGGEVAVGAGQVVEVRR